MPKKLRYKDFDMSCLDRMQLQTDQLEAIRECSLTFTAMIEEALDLGCKGNEIAEQMESMFRIVRRCSNGSA